MGRTSVRLLGVNFTVPEYLLISTFYYKYLGGCILKQYEKGFNISFYRCIYHFLIDLLIIYSSYKTLPLILTDTELLTKVFHCCIFLSLFIFSALSYLEQIRHRETITFLIQALSQVDAILSSTNVTTSHRGLREYAILPLLSTMFCSLDIILDIFGFNNGNIYSFLFYFFLIHKIQAVVFTQVTVYYTILVELLHLNKCIRWLHKTACRDEERYLVLCQAKNKLALICNEVSNVFGCLNLLTLLISLCFMINQPYNLIIRKVRTGPTIIFTTLTWIFFGVANSWSIGTSCEKITEQETLFNDLLYQTVLEDETKMLSSNKKFQIQILMNTKAEFTACGLFPLNHGLVHSMFAAATTYLIILLQFSPTHGIK